MTADIFFLHLSYLIPLIAFAIREIFWLRIVLTASQLGHLVHSYMDLDFNKGQIYHHEQTGPHTHIGYGRETY